MERSNKVTTPASAHRDRSLKIAYLACALLAAGVLLTTLAPWKSEQKAERLKDSTNLPSSWMVHKGELIALRNTGENFTIVASPVRGGAERILYTLPHAQQTIGAPIFTDTEIRLPVTENSSFPPLLPKSIPTPAPTGKSQSPPQGGFGGIVLVSTQRLGSFLPPENADLIPGNAKQMPIVRMLPSGELPPYRETLYRIPLDGSAVKKHPFEWKNAQNVFYSENATYAFRSNERNDTRVVLPNGDWFELRSPTDSLYSRPLTGGTERLVLSELPPIIVRSNVDSILDCIVDNTGVYLRIIRPYPDRSYDLLRIPSAESRPLRIREYRGKDMPTIYAERLWWLESKKVLDAPAGGTTNLISCRLDGNDRQTYSVENDPDGKKVLQERLLNCGGALILLYQREEILKSDGPSERILRNYCARLYPDRTELFSKPLRLPKFYSSFTPEHCSDGYFYYFSEEARSSPLDFLQEKSTTQMVTFLARIRLPE